MDDYERTLTDGYKLQHAQAYWETRRADWADRVARLPLKAQQQILALLLTSPATAHLAVIGPVLDGMILQAEEMRRSRT